MTSAIFFIACVTATFATAWTISAHWCEQLSDFNRQYRRTGPAA